VKFQAPARSSRSSLAREKIVATALGTIPIPFSGSVGSASRSIPVIVCVLPELVCPYARMVQLKPSKNLEMRGYAVDVKIACWVVEGPWTWSKVNCCFFVATVWAVDGVVVGAELADSGSTETEVSETGWTMVR